jgi:hypothetical protein
MRGPSGEVLKAASIKTVQIGQKPAEGETMGGRLERIFDLGPIGSTSTRT